LLPLSASAVTFHCGVPPSPFLIVRRRPQTILGFFPVFEADSCFFSPLRFFPDHFFEQVAASALMFFYDIDALSRALPPVLGMSRDLPLASSEGSFALYRELRKPRVVVTRRFLFFNATTVFPIIPPKFRRAFYSQIWRQMSFFCVLVLFPFFCPPLHHRLVLCRLVSMVLI